MPYMMKKEGDGYCVYKKGPNGEPVGPKKGGPFSEEEAKKQIVALEIAMKNEGKSLLDTIANGFKSLVNILGFGDDEEIEEGDKAKLAVPPAKGEPKSEGKLPIGDTQHLEDAITALGPGFRGHKVQLSPEDRKKAIAEIEAKINSSSVPEEKKAHLRERLASVKEFPWIGFKVIGDNKWIASWTNNFRDRTGEIFSEKSIQAYIDRVYRGEVPFPELWWKHMPAPIGQAKWLALVDHIAIAGGEFNEKPYTKKLIPVLGSKGNEGVSHGYLYFRSDKVNGVYKDFNTFEITAGLAPHRAANQFTSFVVLGDKGMALTEKQIADIRATLGETADEYLDAINQRSKELEKTGVDYKGDTYGAQIETLTETVSKLSGLPELMTKSQEETQKQITDIVTSVKGIVEFLKVQFGDKALASDSKETEVDENDPKVAKLKEQHDKAAVDKKDIDQISMLFPWMTPEATS